MRLDDASRSAIVENEQAPLANSPADDGVEVDVRVHGDLFPSKRLLRRNIPWPMHFWQLTRFLQCAISCITRGIRMDVRSRKPSGIPTVCRFAARDE
jgi:hypothetical protein